jgi:type II secretory pathway pseudopilin PulG
MEMVVVVGLIGILTAVALPGFQIVRDRNSVITGLDLVAAQIRAARLAAISRNARFRIVFECPVPGAVRMLAVTGIPAIDDAADRCTTEQPNDGPAVYMPPDVWFGGDAPPTLEVNGRGEITALGATMPRTITVNHGSFNRNLTVTAAGRVLTPTS